MKSNSATSNFFFLLLCVLAASSCATIAGVDEGGPMPPSGSTYPYDTFVQGLPNRDMREQGGLYLWREGNAWHIRLAKKKERPDPLMPYEPRVEGRIIVERAATVDVKRQNLSQFSEVRQKRNDLVFKFQMQDERVEGFDFRVHPQDLDYCVTLDMTVDGVPRAGVVRLGSFMHIPESLPLKICVRSMDMAPPSKRITR